MIIVMKLLELIEEIPDPRMENKVVHKLSTILFVALCGILSGCESWFDICDYCEAKKEWLSRYVDLSGGSPSGWTFRRVLTLLDPNSIERLLREHAAWLINKSSKVTEQIAVDGKMLLGSGSKDFRCLQSVSAWCCENGLVLAEEQVEAKSNEITAIPLLLESLDLKGNTVTIDAVACQKSISELISEKSGQYVFGLKNNQPKLYKAAVNHVEAIRTSKDNLLYDDFDKSHGRLVRRRYFSYDIGSLPEVDGFASAKTVVAV
jgi:predicted transposase YbfD/YdcC